jgi:hypothetical protein
LKLWEKIQYTISPEDFKALFKIHVREQALVAECTSEYDVLS